MYVREWFRVRKGQRQYRVADSGVFHLDEDLIGPDFVEDHISEHEGVARFLDHESFCRDPLVGDWVAHDAD